MDYNWTKQSGTSGHWLYIDDTKGHVVGSIIFNCFPICSFIGGAKAGEYTDLEIAKTELIEKLRKEKLI